MQSLPQTTSDRRRPWCRIMAMAAFGLLAAAVFGAVEPTVAPAADPAAVSAATAAQSIAAAMEQGRWDQAADLIARQGDDVRQALRPMAAVLEQYQALRQQRQQDRQAVFDEQAAALEALLSGRAAGDPNATDHAVLAQARRLWGDASEAEQADLLARPVIRSMLDDARQKAADACAAGEWDQAAADVRWLMAFEPDSPAHRDLNEHLRQVNAIRAWLKKDPCDDKARRYEQIDPATVDQVFHLLGQCYVEPIDFRSLAVETVRRCAVLGPVMHHRADELLYRADPNQCRDWTDRLTSLAAALAADAAAFDAGDFLGVRDLLMGINDETLRLPHGALLSLMTDAAAARLDAYTQVVWPAGVDDFEKQMTGRFGGVGFRIAKTDAGIEVVSLIPNTPASRSDLPAKSLITAIDGEPTGAMSVACAVRKISGAVGTSVTLTIRPPESDAERLVTLVRDKIVLPTVEGSRQAGNGKAEGRWDYFLADEDRIGYLRLSNFTDGTMNQVETVLARLEADQLAGLILDLRGNGGGLLTAATQMADLFVDEGLLLKSRGRQDNPVQWTATPDAVRRTYPLVVLIDGGSASASEIVAGVLGRSGYGRAVLVGERTYGKGSVQEVVNLGADRGRLKFTAAYYYLPDGRPVRSRTDHGEGQWGIVPDVTVPLYDFEVRRINEVNQKRRGESATADADAVPVCEQMVAADPQLATALLVLKARMAATVANP